MKTELTIIKEALNAYMNPLSVEQFYEAEKVLLKYHKKYGTIDIETIKFLTR